MIDNNELFYEIINQHENKMDDFFCMINNSNYELISIEEEVDDMCLRTTLSFYNSSKEIVIIPIETFYVEE